MSVPLVTGSALDRSARCLARHPGPRMALSGILMRDPARHRECDRPPTGADHGLRHACAASGDLLRRTTTCTESPQ